MSSEYYSSSELEGFKYIQKLAYDAVIFVRSELKSGITEKLASRMVSDYLESKGVERYFHRPFAWFGDRTRFKNFKRPLMMPEKLLKFANFDFHLDLPHFGEDFQPSDRRLEKGMAVILDVAPVYNDYAADIGYSFSYGENKEVGEALRDLKGLRPLILKLIKEGKTLKDIYKETEDLMVKRGYDNCHSIYPLGVLGHKIGKMPKNFLEKKTLMGFSPSSYLYFGKQLGKSLVRKRNEKTPFMTDTANFPPEPGLWAIEPHMGKGDVGVKFEEIMVITDSDAYWLDDGLPHVIN